MTQNGHHIPMFLGMGLAVVLLFVGIGVASANDYYVATWGSDSNPGTEAEPWKTIQKAAKTLIAGDTVYIMEGTYNERVIPKNSGSYGSYITYTAYPGHTVTIDGTGISFGWLNGLFHIDGKNYIKVSGLRIIDSSYMGIQVRGGSDYIIIENNYIYNCQSSGIHVYHGSNNIIIDGNEVSKICMNGAQEGISLVRVDTFEVKNNHVHHCYKEGIDAKGGCSNGKIYKNHVHYTFDSPGNNIGIYVDAYASFEHDIEVYQNLIYDTGYGISLATEQGGELKNINVYNNIAYNNIYAGFHIASYLKPGWKRNVKAINNIFYNNNVGIRIQNTLIDNLVLRNNICSKNGVQIQKSYPGVVTIDHNLIDGSTGVYGDKYITGDPKFANPSARDFHLQATSPAIDKGSSVDAPSFDFDGDSRPYGPGYDIGAYEFQLTEAPDLVGFWRFDEGSGTTAYDSSEYGNDGTIVNGLAWVDGKVGKGLSFDGTDDYVDCGNNPSLSISGAITIEAWVKMPGNPGAFDKNWYLIGKGNALSTKENTGAYALSFYKGNNGLYFDTGDGTTRDILRSTTNNWQKKWYHIVAVWDGTTNPNGKKIYINGNLDNEEASLISSLRTDSPSLRIGHRNIDYFKGKIDEVRIYNRALSAEEILAHYQEGEGNHAPELDSIGDKSVNEGQTLTFTITATDPDGDPLTYSASNLPEGANFDSSSRTFSWTPTHEQAGTYPNVHFEVTDGHLTDSEDITITVAGAPTGTISGTLKDTSNNPIEGATVSANSYSDSTNSTGGYTITLPGGTYTVTASKTGYIPESQENVEVLADQTTTVDFQLTEASDLVGFWRFEEGSGTTALDSSGTGNDGILKPAASGPAWVDGKVDTALSFDGMDDYVDCGNNPTLNISSAITIAAWVKMPGNPGVFDKNWYLVGKGNALSTKENTGAYALSFYKGNNGLYFDTDDGTARDAFRSTTNNWQNKWYHIVAVWDGTTNPDGKKIYIDGNLDNEKTSTISSLRTDSPSLRIGHRNIDYFNGEIDEIRIYNRALSGEEIRADYEAGLKDITPPASISGLQNTTETTWINWTWSNPADADFNHTMVHLNGMWQKNTSITYYNATGLIANTSYGIGTHTVDTYGNVNTTWVNQTTKTLAINSAPVADPNGPYTGTEGIPITFDGSGSSDPDGSIISYAWDFGDGNTTTGVTPTHTYAQNGTYTITLTVIDSESATDTNTTTATIADTEPIADFIGTPTNGSEPLTVAFIDNSTSYDGITAWDWDFDNDGVIDSTAQNSIQVYNESGKYTVSLMVYESDGDSDTITKTDYITVTMVNHAPYRPSNPSPSDGAINISINTDLSWSGGDPDVGDTITYAVYFGTNSSPPLISENQSENTFDPGILNYSTQYYWKVEAKDTHGAYNESEVWEFTTASAHSSDLVGLWHFDEGNGLIAVDSSGNGNSGTLVNDPVWIEGKLGKAISFDGTDDYIDCGNNPSLNIRGAITIEAWVKMPGNPGAFDKNWYLICKGNALSSSEGQGAYALSFYKGNNKLYFDTGDGTTRDALRSTTNNWQNKWYHIVAVWDGTTNPDGKRIYIDGNLDTEKTSTISSLRTDSPSLRIGHRNIDYFNGEIDEVRIYNRALSADEILAHYQEGEGNHAPELDSIGDKSVNEGQTLTFTITATDPDGDPLTYSASNLPEGANFDPSSRTFSWTSNHEQAGTYPNVHFEVTDGHLTDFEDITITIASVPTGTISGIVKDTSNNPIQGATVTADSRSTTTNITGEYTLSNIPEGTHTVTASKTGYFSKSQDNVEVLEDQTTTFDFRLTEASDIVGFWRFEEGSGTTAVDSSGTGNDGTLFNGPAWVDGKVGTALSFDGTDDYVDCGNTPTLNINGAITIEVWVKMPGNPGAFDKNWYLLGKGDALSSGEGHGAYALSFYKGNNKLYFDTGDGTTRDALRSKTNNWQNKWYHIVAVWDGTTNPDGKRIYIDGNLDTVKTSTISSLRTDSPSLRIGHHNIDYFNGKIDEVRIYNRALSAEEIKADYEAGG